MDDSYLHFLTGAVAASLFSGAYLLRAQKLLRAKAEAPEEVPLAIGEVVFFRHKTGPLIPMVLSGHKTKLNAPSEILFKDWTVMLQTREPLVPTPEPVSVYELPEEPDHVPHQH